MDEEIPTIETPEVVAPVAERKPKITTISYSQYSMWLKCPMQWKLAYVDNLRPRDSNINLVFGTAMHIALQTYLQILYTKSAVEADALDVMGIFNDAYAKAIEKEGPKMKAGELDKVEEFRQDAKNILDYVMSPTNRQKHFPSRKYEFLGVELPLKIPLKNGNVTYTGYIDIALKDKTTGKICIFDIKTSTHGWNVYQKSDRTKLDQLVLYKRFYHMLFKVPMEDIEVEFIILKRRLFENVEFPQQRIQRVTPTTGKMTMKEVESSFVDFVKDGFTETGEYNRDKSYIKNPGNAKKNCKYCPFKGTDHCNSKE
jgi:hypothetical protein